MKTEADLVKIIFVAICSCLMPFSVKFLKNLLVFLHNRCPKYLKSEHTFYIDHSYHSFKNKYTKYIYKFLYTPFVYIVMTTGATTFMFFPYFIWMLFGKYFDYTENYYGNVSFIIAFTNFMFFANFYIIFPFYCLLNIKNNENSSYDSYKDGIFPFMLFFSCMYFIFLLL